MKIGVVSAFPPGHGSLNEYGWHLVRALATKREVSEVVLFADDSPAGSPQEIEGVRALVAWRFNALGNLPRLIRAIRRERPDAVIFNLQFASFGSGKVAGGLGLLTPAVTRAIGVPVAVVLHNLVENVDMKDAGFAGSRAMAKVMHEAGRLLTRALLRADYVSLTIPQYVELVRASYGADNVLLAPHGTFEMLDEPIFSAPAGPRRLLAFGKFGTYKTVEVLLDAYRILLARGYDDLEVVIAGTDSPNSPGYLEGVRHANADLSGLVFTGYVEESDVAGVFQSSTVTVFPYSSTTGSSGVLHQAGSYGRAAVLPDIGDFTHVIEEEGFVGQYFSPGDATSLANAIAVLLDDPVRRVEMARRNFIAAAGIPIDEVVDWHLLHLQRIVGAPTRDEASAPPEAGVSAGPGGDRTARSAALDDLLAVAHRAAPLPATVGPTPLSASNAPYRAWSGAPLATQPEISVVIPSYNEEWRILPTVGAVVAEMCQRGEPWELIVSDDGSTDRTQWLIESLGLPNVRFLASPNTGKGGAVRRGVLAARGRYVLFTDADLATPIEQIGMLLTKVRDYGADVAVGSRAARGADVANKSALRQLLSLGLRTVTRIGLPTNVSDTQCGFKLFSAEAAEFLFSTQRVDGFSFDLELLYLARRAGMHVAEVPVAWFDAPGSTVDPIKVSLNFLRDIVDIRVRQLRGGYDMAGWPARRGSVAGRNTVLEAA